MKVVFYWSRLPNYAQACLKELSTRPGVELKVYSLKPPPSFFTSQLIDFEVVDVSIPGALERHAESVLMNQDVVVCSGWIYPELLRAIAKVRKRKRLVAVCMADTLWKSELRQQVRAALGRSRIRGLFDAIWIPGARGIPLAHQLGFRGRALWQGMLSADTKSWLAAPLPLHATQSRSFVFLGRIEPQKGIEVMVKAYERYRDSTENPWSLKVIGDGSLRSMSDVGREGIHWLGALNPETARPIMAGSSCFVLASIDEPWGVVVHEAACLGLPLILSEAVGAASELLRDGYNGRLVESGSEEHLAAAFKWMSEHSQLNALSAGSRALGESITVENWADMFITRIADLKTSTDRSES